MGKFCLHARTFIIDRIIIKVAGNQDFDVNATNAKDSNKRTNEHTKGRTEKRKDESINAGGITTRNPFFY